MTLLKWQALSDHFAERRGVGMSFHTLQAWQAMGMPYIKSGRLTFFDPEACWQWYIDRFTVERSA